MKTKYAQLKRMLQGPVSANKASSVWCFPSHGHIHTSLAGKFLISAVIVVPPHLSTLGALMSRCHFPPYLSPFGALPTTVKEKNTVRSLATGIALQEIPNKNLIMYCLTILFACRPPRRRCNSDEHTPSDGLWAAIVHGVCHTQSLASACGAPSERSRSVAAFQPAFLLISQLVAQCYNR